MGSNVALPGVVAAGNVPHRHGSRRVAGDDGRAVGAQNAGGANVAGTKVVQRVAGACVVHRKGAGVGHEHDLAELGVGEYRARQLAHVRRANVVEHALGHHARVPDSSMLRTERDDGRVAGEHQLTHGVLVVERVHARVLGTIARVPRSHDAVGRRGDDQRHGARGAVLRRERDVGRLLLVKVRLHQAAECGIPDTMHRFNQSGTKPPRYPIRSQTRERTEQYDRYRETQ